MKPTTRRRFIQAVASSGVATVVPWRSLYADYQTPGVWHCHILEHEEHDMMRPLVVI